MAKDIRIDPRGPRFGAAVTLVVAVATIVIGANSVGLVLAFLLAALFLPGAIVGPQATVQSAIFQKWVRPRLDPPAETESFRAPRFAQQVGLGFSILAIVFLGLNVVLGFYIAIGFVVLASFLNAVFDFCMGCEVYLLATRATRRA
ncbi:DUF4395 domain-containing protein [Demequina zhanjiangensis]|uniref:DUF4395 domain-containing protein n=1 Tax=Demequina zhanjiangensis TaxID=3051659 RepID=A0ABT8G456_9MICO|nr:DUF4395 domain-containing protein [Demequina sp. SYSU T00b26]MDN4473924.1 DUF4395 domain-containing protein [Demequina sp. SYSU T00b26]